MSIKENAMLIILKAIDLMEKGYEKYSAYKIAAEEILKNDRGNTNE